MFVRMISSELQIILLKVTVRAYIIKIWVSVLFSKQLVYLQQNNIISRNNLWKNWITAFKIKVTAVIQNVSECFSGWYLLNQELFCYQTWYCDASSWARVPCRKVGLLFSRSRSQQRVRMSVLVQMISSKLTNILLPNLMLWCIMSQSVVQKKVGLLSSRSRSQQGFIWSWQFLLLSSALLILLLSNLVW